MLRKRIVDRIIPILKKDVRRALSMKVKGFPRPYYCSFLLRDIRWFNTWASSGSTYRKRSDHTRNVYCDLRLGSYRCDQTTEGGLNDNDEDLDSASHVTVPIDDHDLSGMRVSLWRLSEAKFREAITDHNNKMASRIHTIDSNQRYPSFVRTRPRKSIKYGTAEPVDEMYWMRFCKQASKWLSRLPHVSGNWVEFDSQRETHIFVSTEGSVIVQNRQVFSLHATIRNLISEGTFIEQELDLNCGTLRELPDMKTFRRMMLQKYQQLLNLMKAKKIHSFSGPVLLYPIPAGLLFHEAIGHRVEGSRLLSSGEGQTFKGQVGKRIIPAELTMRDNPRIKRFKGQRCVGAYDFDDEGSPSKNAVLIEDGILKGFLNTRAALNSRNHKPNGHARNKKFQRPISRMAVTIIEGQQPVSLKRLKELLIEEIKLQKKPFGMIVYETSGGETETTTYDFQAFSGEISYATLVYPDGKEVSVRGVNFVGTPLQALHNIAAIGDELVLDNGYCGAESGFLPISTISPAILLRNLELQSKQEELVTQYILPGPGS